MTTTSKPTYRMSVLQSLHILTAVSHDKAMTSELVCDHINEHPDTFPVMTKDQTSAALANCKALDLVASRPNSNNGAPTASHLWWLTAGGVRAALTGVMPSKKPVDTTPVVEQEQSFTSQDAVNAVIAARRKRSTPQPSVTAIVVFTFNGTKYALPVEVIKAIKEFTL